MKYVDEYRDPDQARRLLQQIRGTVTRPWVLMEVCGGQTHSLLRYGIAQELRDSIELIHGPGCPVCVTPAAAIDFAQSLAARPETTLVSFGDMLRVPGTGESLLDARRNGASVKTVYSPLDAVQLAQENPHEEFVFFAVGFETTAPATALAVLQAEQLALSNFSLLSAHVCVLPAMRAILEAANNRVQGFLAAGHVCTVTGFEAYHQLADEFQTPIVVMGFEPTDLLQGILSCVQQLEGGQHTVQNRYARSVAGTGNVDAQRIVDRVFEVSSRPWRGLGEVPSGGLVLREEWRAFDASYRYASRACTAVDCGDAGVCRAADVLTGRLRPDQCAEFNVTCHPESPLGAPMVSSEGACAAYYRFGQSSHHIPRDVAK